MSNDTSDSKDIFISFLILIIIILLFLPLLKTFFNSEDNIQDKQIFTDLCLNNSWIIMTTDNEACFYNWTVYYYWFKLEEAILKNKTLPLNTPTNE